MHWVYRLPVAAMALSLTLAGCSPTATPTAKVPQETTQTPEPVRPSEQQCTGSVLTDRMCTMEYVPVCGCDGKTYSNACVAGVAGVQHWRDGKCGAGNALE